MEMMESKTYYEGFMEYFLTHFKTHEEIFKAGKEMEKALLAAMNHAAGEKWYGRHQMDKDSD